MILKIEKVLVQGVIDLFLEDADGITLIDYKLSTIQKDEDLLRKYKTQMQLYKFAIETITGKRVKKVYILNILSGKLVELT
ncbi:MAG: PD-(D/E)XK nuclease family protein [Clostridia bacterium]|nr:PD-(D/E)XK nuclease family protein [Clostridia bacterium]